jgi:hypothetical protein
MLRLDTKTSLYAEDQGLHVQMALEHDKTVGTPFCALGQDYPLTRPSPGTNPVMYPSFLALE